MRDPFEMTVASYCDPRGAQAFVDKEMPVHAERTAHAFQILKGVDVRGMRVLDAGCGFGRDVGTFRQMGAEAWGCDVSPVLLEKARADHGDFFAVDDMRGAGAFPFAGPFDLLWCCAVLVHVPREELQAVLRRMWEALKVGGRLVVITKQGEGERVMGNLGAGLERVMVYYREKEILDVLETWGAVVEVNSGELTPLPTGDRLMALRVRKP